MDTDQLRAFVAVAQAGWFSRAAKRTGVPQPNLSRRVQQLEKELGAKLVVRARSGVVPTEAGARFLPHAERALAALAAGTLELEEIAGTPRGVVSIGAQHTIGAFALPSVLARFRKSHPGVRLRVVEALPQKLEERVVRGELDLILMNLPVKHLDLAAQKLWQEDYLLAAPLGHWLASVKRPVALTEVVEEELVVLPNVPATHALEAACAERGVEPRIAVEADNLQAVRRMVERGLGIAILPRLVVEAVEGSKRFAAIEIAHGGPRRHVALVHRGDAYLSSAARALRDELVRALKRPKT